MQNSALLWKQKCMEQEISNCTNESMFTTSMSGNSKHNLSVSINFMGLTCMELDWVWTSLQQFAGELVLYLALVQMDLNKLDLILLELALAWAFYDKPSCFGLGPVGHKILFSRRRML